MHTFGENIKSLNDEACSGLSSKYSSVIEMRFFIITLNGPNQKPINFTQTSVF